jgi:hypothetical protein
MWMVDPKAMCQQHLLGEHVETHMLAGSLNRGRSIDGFLAKGLLEPQNLAARHAALAAEITARGMHHRSPLQAFRRVVEGSVDVKASYIELARRCAKCADAQAWFRRAEE